MKNKSIIFKLFMKRLKYEVYILITWFKASETVKWLSIKKAIFVLYFLE
jgi:hypothetical protein